MSVCGIICQLLNVVVVCLFIVDPLYVSIMLYVGLSILYCCLLLVLVCHNCVSVVLLKLSALWPFLL